MEKISRKDMINKIAEKGDFTKKSAELAYSAVTAALIEVFNEGYNVHLPNLGSFVVKEVAACTRRNPLTGNEVLDPAHMKVSFKPSTVLKQQLRRISV